MPARRPAAEPPHPRSPIPVSIPIQPPYLNEEYGHDRTALKDLADYSPLDGDWEYVLRIPRTPLGPGIVRAHVRAVLSRHRVRDAVLDNVEPSPPSWSPTLLSVRGIPCPYGSCERAAV